MAAITDGGARPYSPLPWRVAGDYVLDQRGCVVSSVAQLMESGLYLEREDAAFTCLAVNAHAALVDALKPLVLRTAAGNAVFVALTEANAERALAALALVEAK